MPRGQTESPFGLQERKEIAFRRFSQGYKNSDVARELQVGADTIARYRTDYETELGSLARTNPRFLQDVLANTLRALNEADEIRQNAWSRINQGERVEIFSCDNCEHEMEIEYPMSDQSRAQLLNVVLKAQEQRAKLYGLFGVKQEFFAMVNNVKIVQDKLLEFMRNELCREDQQKLERFMLTELAEFMGHEGASHTLEASVEGLSELAASAVSN